MKGLGNDTHLAPFIRVALIVLFLSEMGNWQITLAEFSPQNSISFPTYEDGIVIRGHVICELHNALEYGAAAVIYSGSSDKPILAHTCPRYLCIRFSRCPSLSW